MSESNITLQVLFFATLKELTGKRQVELTLPSGATIKYLKEYLREQFPVLRETLSNSVSSINHEFAQDEDLIPSGAEVAIFPPVSGGSVGYPEIFSVTDAELDLNDLLAKITLPSTGAACIFTGMVRGITLRDDPHNTTYLEYEAYVPMAEKKMRQVAEEIRKRWPSVEGIAILQRVGRLNPGTPTVLIACTAAHRDTGVFEASRYGIDRLKEIVPIWKKEVSPEGQEWIEGDYIPTVED